MTVAEELRASTGPVTSHAVRDAARYLLLNKAAVYTSLAEDGSYAGINVRSFGDPSVQQIADLIGLVNVRPSPRGYTQFSGQLELGERTFDLWIERVMRADDVLAAMTAASAELERGDTLLLLHAVQHIPVGEVDPAVRALWSSVLSETGRAGATLNQDTLLQIWRQQRHSVAALAAAVSPGPSTGP